MKTRWYVLKMDDGDNAFIETEDSSRRNGWEWALDDPETAP